MISLFSKWLARFISISEKRNEQTQVCKQLNIAAYWEILRTKFTGKCISGMTHLTTYRIMYFVELKCVFLLQFESHLYSIKCSHFNSIVFHIYNGKLSTVVFTFIVYVPLNSMCSTFTVHPVFNFWKNASSFNSKIWKDPLLKYNGPPPTTCSTLQHMVVPLFYNKRPLTSLARRKLNIYCVLKF